MKKLMPMRVKDLMTTDVVFVKTDSPISEVAEILRKHNIPGVPVVNEDRMVQGLITERELFTGDRQLHYPTYINLLKQTDFVLGGKKEMPYEAGRITRIIAEEIMNRQAVFAPEDMELTKLASKMLAEEAEIVPVVDHSNRLLGTISKNDLLKFFAKVETLPKLAGKPRYVDNEFDYVQKNLTSRFAFVAKARANIWITAATVLFIIGFLAGMVYVVNPRIFNVQNGRINIEANRP